jgi:flagellar L-ring protein FlgH
MKKGCIWLVLSVGGAWLGCASPRGPISIPALEYSQQLWARQTSGRERVPLARPAAAAEPRAAIRFAKGEPVPAGAAGVGGTGVVTNLAPDSESLMFQSAAAETRPYEGPLALGDPGLTSSLWQESRRENNLFRDERAWQPYDLITILISESAEGKKQADTNTKSETTLTAAIKNFLGIAERLQTQNKMADLRALVDADTSNEFKSTGQTNRKDTLKGTISAMVVEVLPGGILRVAGKKILSVNDEEQIMVISGLVRPKDIDAGNEVDSSKIAQLRVDYFGRGSLGDIQSEGWLGQLFNKIWPF